MKLVAFSFLAVALTVAAQDSRLLTDSVIPSKYEIIIEPNFTTHTFHGEVNIYLKAMRANIRAIILNIVDLSIESSWRLTRKDFPGFQLPKGIAVEDKETQTVNLPFTSPLDLDQEYLLILPYTGKINEQNGFFFEHFTHGEHEASVFGTNLSPIYSRMLFPCFDEPAFKAEFQLSVRESEKYEVISNGLVGERVEQEESVNYFFPTTKCAISPNAFGFLISNFHKLTEGSMSVWSHHEDTKSHQFALNAANKVLHNLNEYTSYSLNAITEKLDLVALPDLTPKSYEMLGAIYFREMYLLAEDTSSSADREVIIKEISNKIARQWFGVLVTPSFWDHIWVSYGMTKFLEAKAYPETYQLSQTMIHELQDTLRVDSCDTHAVVYDVKDLDQLVEVSDADVIYTVKGAAILRWIESIIGVDSFRTYIRRYLTENNFKTVTTETLIKALDETVFGTQISLIFKEWLENPGYPLVTATRTDSTLILHQAQFHLRPSIVPPLIRRWNIPINVATTTAEFDKIAATSLFPSNVNEWEVKLSTDNAPFYILNTQQIGFYRVNYDTDNWNAIRETLKRSLNDIHVLNRAQIVDDLFALAETKELDYDFVFDILEYLQDEREHQPWKSALNGFNRLSQKKMEQSDYENLYEAYTRWFLRSLYSELGFYPKDGESHLNKLLRSEMLYTASKFDLHECVTEAAKEFKSFKDNNKEINSDLQFPVFCSAVRRGEKDDYDFLWKRYQQESSEAQKLRYLAGMTCTRNHAEDLLNKILGNEIVAFNKFSTFEKLLVENSENVDVTLEFLATKWSQWKDQMCIVKTLSSIAQSIFKESQMARFKELIETLKREGVLTAENDEELEKMVKVAEYNVDWTNERLPELYNRMKRLDFIKDNSAQRFVQSGVMVAVVAVIFRIIL